MPQDSSATASKALLPSSRLRQARLGLWLAGLAVLLWSFGSALVFLGAREAGTWRFVGLASSTAGVLQLIFTQVYRGNIRCAVRLPARLWLGPMVCFISYGLAWPWALALATDSTVGAVNLVNYLWPTLTVVFAAWLVPGSKFTARTAVAVGLGLFAIILANGQVFGTLFAGNAAALKPGASLPFVLASIAALTWATYSALLARWNGWAGQYVTSPLGFLVIAIVAWVITLRQPHSIPLSKGGLLLTLLYGIGPLGVGYLLWEIALSLGEVQSLGLLAAATPVLSTLWLCCCTRRLPEPQLGAAAFLICASVLLSRPRNPEKVKANPVAGQGDTGTPRQLPIGSRDRAPDIS